MLGEGRIYDATGRCKVIVRGYDRANFQRKWDTLKTQGMLLSELYLLPLQSRSKPQSVDYVMCQETIDSTWQVEATTEETKDFIRKVKRITSRRLTPKKRSVSCWKVSGMIPPSGMSAPGRVIPPFSVVDTSLLYH